MLFQKSFPPVALLLFLGFGGCDKKPETAAPPAPAPAVESQQNTADALLGAANSPAADRTPATMRPDGLPDGPTLYQAVQKFMIARKGYAPKTVDDLVLGGFLPPISPPPPGKKYELDARGCVINVVSAAKK